MRQYPELLATREEYDNLIKLRTLEVEGKMAKSMENDYYVKKEKELCRKSSILKKECLGIKDGFV